MNRSEAISKLDELLQSEIFPDFLLKNKTLFIFGTGNTSLLYEKCFLAEHLDISCFCDNFAKKTNFMGRAVISPNEIRKISAEKSPFVLVCSARGRTNKEICHQLSQLDVEHMPIDRYVFLTRRRELLSVMGMLEDEYSRKVFYEVIKARLRNEPMDVAYVTRPQYFCLPEFLERSEKEVFVDVGAYVGDSVENYIYEKAGVFGTIYAFEPNPRSFIAMEHRIDRLKLEWALAHKKINLVPMGVGISEEILEFDTGDELSAALGAKFSGQSGNGQKIEVTTIDKYFANERISFIKADIEGYEYDMLLGAAEVIKRDKPLLAICMYHNATDLYAVPLLIKELNPDYRLTIRHHVLHTDMIIDTVVYAY